MSEQAESTFWQRQFAFGICGLVFVGPMLVLEAIGLRDDWVSFLALASFVAFYFWNRHQEPDRFHGMALPVLLFFGSATIAVIGRENDGAFFEILFAVGLIGLIPAMLYWLYVLSGIGWLFKY